MTGGSIKRKKLTDAERHKRFIDMAKEVGATEETPRFDEAIKKVASSKARPIRKPSSPDGA